MAGLTDGAETRALNWLLGKSTTAPTLPLMLRLMTANGSDSAAGTQVTGGSYAPQQIDTDAVADGVSANSAVIEFALMPACTVVGFEIWDSAGTPFRWWVGTASASKTYEAGDTARVAIGALDFTLD